MAAITYNGLDGDAIRHGSGVLPATADKVREVPVEGADFVDLYYTGTAGALVSRDQSLTDETDDGDEGVLFPVGTWHRIPTRGLGGSLFVYHPSDTSQTLYVQLMSVSS